MANAAAKKQAVSNTQSLKALHIASLLVNLIFILSHVFLNRPRSIKPYVILSIPAFLLQYQIERMGRPKYDSKGALLSAGDDLRQEGLTDYFHDIIYVTWICDILSVIVGRNWVWYFYFSIPSYAGYKIYSIFFAGRTSSSSSEEVDPGKSKRQEKLEKKGQRVKYSR